MARTHERIIALVIAILFFVTAVGTGAAVVWDVMQNKKEQKTVDNTSPSTNQANQDTTKPDPNQAKLEGTPLSGFTPMPSIAKLSYTDTKVGSGDTVKKGDTITVDYTGAVASTGKIFQSSIDYGQPVTFPLSNVIQGWQEGVPGMKVGGVRRLYIPTSLAYGASPPAGIPANADLVFDITVRSIGKQ